MPRACFWAFGILVAAATWSGALAQSAGGEQNSKAPAVPVSVAEIVEKSIAVDRVYTGTTAAVKAVELRAQVTGYLSERSFAEGTIVSADDTLYKIDPRPFQAILDQKKAELQEQQAVLDYAKTSQKRYAAAARAGAAAREQLDQAIELEAKTEASIGVYQAEIEQARINLEFTEIKAPFEGRVGRTFVNIGALVNANDTVLTSLVQLDPIYVYFSPPETDLLLIESHQAQAPLPVTLTLPHATQTAFKGTLSFISNTADAKTATITMRATVSNAERKIRPGQFAIVRLHITETPNALVVPAKAISSIQGQRFVMVVGKYNKLERRSVTLGRQVESDAYVVEKGLKKGERVVVSDIQTLKAGETVSPQREPAS